MTARVVVAGLGNPYRRDDGVGPAVVDAARPKGPAGVVFADPPGDAIRLLELWSGADLCVLVDAVITGTSAGTVHRVELHVRDAGESIDGSFPAASCHSTHALAIGDAVALGRALDRLPRRLVVVGVEAGDTRDGPGLSPAVTAALPDAVQAVLDELRDERRHEAGIH